ncbi:hypothetical protein NLX67_10250 [Domibacillus sp. A3M-37]|uniref:hypothetical protein n=1 Tax=Domibacillus sp. A3M-37 TaxID=2962037 RepID=UPI0020B83B2D|nr:hypothetical protein [Domibacillus sp. A3M-37]MCP3762771.1 hypothetical protein [Domibacillus sp. A3M-37]
MYDKKKKGGAGYKLLREAASEEMPCLYKLGYKEWPKGRPLDQYIKDNQKEKSHRTRKERKV